MTKKEVIWRDILYEVRVNRRIKFTQKELSQKFGFSLSTVFNALKVPRAANIIEATGRFFILKDYSKLLSLWAASRSFKKDIIFKGFSKLSISELEAIAPPESVFGLYSAFKFQFKEIPADYDHLYLYMEENDFKKNINRFSFSTNKNKDFVNVYILEKDSWFKNYGNSILPEQIYTDIWNAPEWYAKDFLRILQEKLIF